MPEAICKNGIKHIAIRHHFIREKVTDGTIQLKYITTHKNPVGLLTITGNSSGKDATIRRS